jgi:hypothetical protein
MVRSLDGNWQICETAFIAAPDVFRWNIVTSRQDPISDSRQIDLHIFRANVDQHDLEPSPPRVQHHPQVILPRQRGFNGEAFSLRQMFARRLQNLTCTSNRKCCQSSRLESPTNRIGIEHRNRLEQLGIPASQSCLARTVCSSDKGKSWTAQRDDWLEDETCFRCCSARISFRRFLSIAKPARAAWAIFCAISSHFPMAKGYSNAADSQTPG